MTNKKFKKLECGHKDHDNPLEFCKKGYPCYINAPEYYNCFMVYKYYIDHSYTLQEVAEILDMSHTTVKAIEDQALSKIRLAIDTEGELSQLKELKPLLEN